MTERRDAKSRWTKYIEKKRKKRIRSLKFYSFFVLFFFIYSFRFERASPFSKISCRFRTDRFDSDVVFVLAKSVVVYARVDRAGCRAAVSTKRFVVIRMKRTSCGEKEEKTHTDRV